MLKTPSAVKELLVRQVSSSVLWEDSINRMLQNGVDTFVEIGPGKVLSGFVKKISKEVRTFNIEDLDSLNKTLAGNIKNYINQRIGRRCI